MLLQHPHRGFSEVPYIKLGGMHTVDHWGTKGVQRPGSLQWGMAGSGIQHGGGPAPDVEGAGDEMQGFQLWVNLPAANKMDPPVFQDASPEALPEVQLSDCLRAKVLVGALGDSSSPIQTIVPVTYVDYMCAPGGDGVHEFDAEQSARFVYVYGGEGIVGEQRCCKGDVLRLSTEGEALSFSNAGETEFGFVLLSGRPIGEPVVQHGPFVMASREQIMEAFRDYQMGGLCEEKCSYVKY